MDKLRTMMPKKKIRGMEELTGCGSMQQKDTSPRGNDKLKKLIVNEYKDVTSPAFSKSASTVKRILLKKNPSLRLIDRFV